MLITIIFIFWIASTAGIQVNQTEGLGGFRREEVHGLSNLWPLHSLTGLLGSILNIFVLYIFISDRQTLTTSINSMIWYSTAQYSTV